MLPAESKNVYLICVKLKLAALRWIKLVQNTRKHQNLIMALYFTKYGTNLTNIKLSSKNQCFKQYACK